MTIAIATPDEWLAARRRLMDKEKALTRAKDEMAAARRALPWLPIDKDYRFESEAGPVDLADLFAGKSQLVVYHFMYGPDWTAGCKSCSFWCDGFDPMVVHLAARDVALAAISRAPLETLLAYRRRLGWSFPWVSSRDSDFNFDFHVSFRPDDGRGEGPNYNFATQRFGMSDAPGLSVFAKDGKGRVHLTYACFARGLDHLNAAYQILDLVPKGRDEEAPHHPMSWLRRRDEYQG